jgi:hypothetical protein
VVEQGGDWRASSATLPHYELFERWDGPAVRVSYALPNEQMYYEIGMQTTQPRLGGVRWWFKCPMVCSNGRPCGRRVQMLYLPPNGRQFGCRGCHHLWYESQRQDARKRAMGKVQKIRERMGGTAVLGGVFPEKPRG